MPWCQSVGTSGSAVECEDEDRGGGLTGDEPGRDGVGLTLLPCRTVVLPCRRRRCWRVVSGEEVKYQNKRVLSEIDSLINLSTRVSHGLNHYYSLTYYSLTRTSALVLVTT